MRLRGGVFAWFTLGALLVVLPGALRAQVRPIPPTPPPTGGGGVRPAVPLPSRPGTDTTRRRLTPSDTIRRDSLSAADSATAARLRFSEADSVMRALMNRRGYVVTRYEGANVTYDANNQLLQILADGKRALVERDSEAVVTDSAVYYDEKAKKAVVLSTPGRQFILHNPASGQADVVGSGRLDYSFTQRTARITNPVFAVNTGQEWRVRASQGVMVAGDTTRKQGPSFYGLGGQLTSCVDSIPDYHFEFKEIKRAGDNTLVARPAILFIRDIPVVWLPFIFQDTRSGRHSGILTPRFGVSDFIRNSPAYRRNLEGLGYYFAINDYMDASAWLDWRSAAGASEGDPGWTRYNAQWQYSWLDRFLSGSLASSYTNQNDGFTNLAITWGHQQQFTRDRRFSSNVNYVTSTTLQRRNTWNPYTALATIRSQANYSDRIGPFTLQLGGGRTQYPGRVQVDQTIPTVTLSTPTLQLAPWLAWTPNMSFNSTQTLRIDQAGPGAFNFFTNPSTGALDSTAVKRNRYNTTASFDTPFKIFGYDLRNSFRFSHELLNFPQPPTTLFDVQTGDSVGTRIFANGYRSEVDWTPDFQLPPLARNVFNLTPSVSLQNSTAGAFWVRTPLSNGQWVHQSKRPTFGVSASPMIYGLFPGIGVFTRFRHTLQPSISYTYAPRANIDTSYLKALGRSFGREFSGLQTNAISFGLNQTIEAKVRAPGDTNPEGGEKLKLLSLGLSPLSYDVDRARAAHSAIRGLTTPAFGYNLSSDLLPGFQFSSDFSLFQGDPISDSAKFSPFRERVSASLTLARGNNPFVVLTRLFGRAVPADIRPTQGPTPEQVARGMTDIETHRISNIPVAGSGARSNALIVPPDQGWSVSLTFSSARTRPPIGGNVVELDPKVLCRQRFGAPGQELLLDACLAQQIPTNQDPIQLNLNGATVFRNPPTTNLGGNFVFPITEKWSASWNTSYDFVQHEFAQHIVSLQRDLHDWRAFFGFTQSPNGNFAFSFYISLKAEPDLKVDYSRATIRTLTGAQ